MAQQSDLSDKVAIAALVVAAVAFVTTVVQLAQAIIAAARGLPNCDKRVMGDWAKWTSIRFKWLQLRLEVDFEAPVIFLAPTDNRNGPVKDNPDIWYADGTLESCKLTRVTLPQGDDVDGIVFHRGRERVHTVDNELATWVTLLGAIQRMERDSRDWELSRSINRLRPIPPEVTTLAVGIQTKKRSFDTNPTVKKPYATSNICHLVELAAVLGLYWKEFNRDENKYRAEGNGYSLLGTRLDDMGIVFVFEKTGWARFKENRIIPASEVKEFCFGNVPTFYRHIKDDEQWKIPFSPQKTLRTLQLGSRKEVADTLNLIGCNTNTSLYYIREKRHIHIFPVVFEILGMLGRTIHVRNRCFTYLPNPTIFPWNRGSFSIRRMLKAFHDQLGKLIEDFNSASHGQQLPVELEHVNAIARKLNRELPQTDDGFSPQHLGMLHEALDEIDEMLVETKIDKDVVLDVLRRHLQEILLAINTTAEQAAGNAPVPGTPIARADISFDDLLGVPPENREKRFMEKYFYEIRPRVVSTNFRDHHDPDAAEASRVIHNNSAQEQSPQQQQGPDQPPTTDRGQTQRSSSEPSQSVSSVPHPIDTSIRGVYTSHADRVRASARDMRRTNTWSESVRDAFELRRNNIWCMLVLRMLCWLLLHDFDEKDVQLSKSELIGSRLPVYIM